MASQQNGEIKEEHTNDADGSDTMVAPTPKRKKGGGPAAAKKPAAKKRGRPKKNAGGSDPQPPPKKKKKRGGGPKKKSQTKNQNRNASEDEQEDQPSPDTDRTRRTAAQARQASEHPISVQFHRGDDSLPIIPRLVLQCSSGKDLLKKAREWANKFSNATIPFKAINKKEKDVRFKLGGLAFTKGEFESGLEIGDILDFKNKQQVVKIEVIAIDLNTKPASKKKK